MIEPHIGDCVKLKEDYSEVYLQAPPGATGTIRDRKLDEYGDTLVWISWDPGSHTETSGWTYPHHLEVISPDNHTIARFTDKAKIRLQREERERVEKEEEYQDFLSRAIDLAVDSEGFFMVTVKKDEDGDYVPFGFALSQTEEAGLILEAQIVQLAAEAHQHHAQRTLRYLRSDDDDV